MSERTPGFLARRSIAIDRWPEAHRVAWLAAQRPGDPIDPGGIAASWSAATRRKTAAGYGCYLAWLAERGELDFGETPAECITRERLAIYLVDLRQAYRGHTIQNRIQELGDALRALAPEGDWSWILRAAARLRASTIPAHDKRSRQVPIQVLAAAGFRLMLAAENDADLSALGPGKRQARGNPRDEWVIHQVPELRIVDDLLWEAAKARQTHIRHQLTHDHAGVRSERARRPVYLLSNLIRCGVCGGGFSKISTHHYGCSNARNRGTCNNRLTIRKDVLEASVLSGLKTHLMNPDLVKEFVAEYHRELNRLNARREQAHAEEAAEYARVERQIRAIVDAIKDGLRTPAMKDELLALEVRKATLVARIKHAPPPAPRLHPRLADLYRQQVERLHDELNLPEFRSEAALTLRGLIDEVRLMPENGGLEIELVGDLAGILALRAGCK